jgi:type I restriction enzyme, S subunit
VSVRLASIGEFCITGSGGTPSRKKPEYYGGTIPWIKSGDLRENVVTAATEFISQEAVAESSAKIVPKGAILLAMYGATVGRMAILGLEAATNQAVCFIIPDENRAHTRYVYYALLSKVPEFLRNAVGGAQPNINQGMVKDTRISLPSLAEQERIAAILDRTEDLRRKRQQSIQLTDEFLRAVFLDMFGDPIVNTKSWETCPLGDIFNLSSGRSLIAKDMDEHGEFEVYGGNGVNGTHSEYMFEEPQLVIGRVGVYCGAIHISTPKSWITDNALYVKQYKRPCNIHFMAELLKLANLNQYAGRAAQPLVSGNRIYPVETIFPPLEHQIEFEKKKEELNTLFAKVKVSEAAMDELFASISQKAFSGEL